jgi:DNA primase
LPLSQFLLDTLAQDVDIASPDGKARLAALAKPLIGRLPDGVYRALLVEELAARVGLAHRRLDELLGLDVSAAPAPVAPRRPARRPVAAGARGSLARQGISLLLHYPAVATRVDLPADLAASGQRGAELLIELHTLAAGRPGLRTATLLERFRGRPELPHLEQLVAGEPLVGPEAAEREFADCIARLYSGAVQQKLAGLLAKAGRETLSQAEKDELRALQRQVAGQPAQN